LLENCYLTFLDLFFAKLCSNIFFITSWHSIDPKKHTKTKFIFKKTKNDPWFFCKNIFVCSNFFKNFQQTTDSAQKVSLDILKAWTMKGLQACFLRTQNLNCAESVQVSGFWRFEIIAFFLLSDSAFVWGQATKTEMFKDNWNLPNLNMNLKSVIRFGFQKAIRTVPRPVVGVFAVMSSICCVLFGLWPCSLAPCFLQCFADYEHHCPVCNHLIGKYRRGMAAKFYV
jgi:hypothetical protein